MVTQKANETGQGDTARSGGEWLLYCSIQPTKDTSVSILLYLNYKMKTFSSGFKLEKNQFLSSCFKD